MNNRHKAISEINITPLTDVMLVLLIIFMVTAPLLLQTGMPVKLPKASSTEYSQSRGVVVSVSKEGNIFLNDKKIEPVNLKTRIFALLKRSADKSVIVKADEGVKHGIVVTVLDAAKQAGAQKLAISTEPK